MKELINKDFLEAFKNKNNFTKNFLGLIKGEIQTEEKRTGEEVDIMAILKKMEKSLIATNDIEAQKQLEILKKYLPTMMGAEEIENILLNYKSEGISTLPEFMSAFNRDHKGKADNKLVVTIIKQILS